MLKSLLFIADDPFLPAFSTVGHAAQNNFGDFQPGFTKANYKRHNEYNNE